MTVLHGLETRLQLARLGLVTDTRGGGTDWEEFCRAVFAGGVDILIIDEPDLPAAELAQAVETGIQAGFSRGRIVGVSYPQLPPLSLDLLHLATREEIDLAALAASAALIGRPLQTVADLQRWLAEPALAYVSVGPVLDSGEEDPRRGLALIRAAAELAPPADPEAKPWFATGGIGEANLGAVLEAGARRVMVRRAITAAGDPYAAARSWADRLRKAWNDDQTMKSYVRTIRHLDRGRG